LKICNIPGIILIWLVEHDVNLTDTMRELLSVNCSWNIAKRVQAHRNAIDSNGMTPW